MSVEKIAVLRLANGAGLPMPAYATPDSAGMDLVAAVDTEVTLQPGARTVVPTGIAIALPVGYEAQIRPRSGLALNDGITVLNSPGTIDADYRGEVGIILVNFGNQPFVVRRGARVAQLVVAPVLRLTWNEVAELPSSDRGLGGFGSTGKT